MVIKQGVKRSAGGAAGSCCVFVRGFDFGTTDEQLLAHMSNAGTVENVKWISKGSAEVTYSSADEAAAAVQLLQASTIDGNSRFMDVLPTEGGNSATKRFNSGGKGQGGGSGAAGSCVFVRGFDFGTTDDQFAAHMSTAGTVQNVKWITKGSAEVTYSSADEAAAAVQLLQASTIDGNTRFIDVMPSNGTADGDRGTKGTSSGGKGQWGHSGGNGQWGHSGGNGQGGIMEMLMSIMGGGGKSMGKGGGGGKSGQKGKKHDDPPGSATVFVRGFDFGTTDEQFEGHMSRAGPIHRVGWVSKGSACVVYRKKASALKAVSTLNQTVLEGNSRYIDVILNEE